jgi:hypothetical protein
MRFDWSTLGAKAPTALVRARNVTHHAVQWVVKAARANLPAAADDEHANLVWDGARAAFISQPIAAANAEIRIGFSLRRFALIILRNNRDLDEYELGGRKDASVAVWFDSAMRVLGLKGVGEIDLPYALPSLPVMRGSAYHVSGESEALEELARWYDAAADLLAGVLAAQNLAAPVVCQPQHLHLCAQPAMAADADGIARSMTLGMSPGDEHYAQPYFYLRTTPRLKPADLPLIAEPGRWHLQGFVGAVATAEDILMQSDPRATAAEFFDTVTGIGRARLGG